MVTHTSPFHSLTAKLPKANLRRKLQTVAVQKLRYKLYLKNPQAWNGRRLCEFLLFFFFLRQRKEVEIVLAKIEAAVEAWECTPHFVGDFRVNHVLQLWHHNRQKKTKIHTFWCIICLYTKQTFEKDLTFCSTERSKKNQISLSYACAKKNGKSYWNASLDVWCPTLRDPFKLWTVFRLWSLLGLGVWFIAVFVSVAHWSENHSHFDQYRDYFMKYPDLLNFGKS